MKKTRIVILLLCAIAIGTSWPLYARLSIFGDGFIARNLFVSYSYMLLISAFEILFILSLGLLFQKLKTKYRFFVFLILATPCAFWWLVNLLEFRLLGYVRSPTSDVVKMAHQFSKELIGSALIGVKKIDILLAFVSLFGFVSIFTWTTHLVGSRLKTWQLILPTPIAILSVTFFLLADAYRANPDGSVLKNLEDRLNAVLCCPSSFVTVADII